MLDKKLIEKKFKNSINFYDDNAIIQELMAKKLVSLIPNKKYSNILEIGSYSGILTKKIIQKFEFDNYLALDIVNSFEKIKKLSSKISFVQQDVEKFSCDKKFDLIVANASLQWCCDFEKTISKLKSYLVDDGILAITIFSNDNFYEIREAFKVGLDYKTIEEIEKIFSKNVKIMQEMHTLCFDTPNELLKHLKLTGVNAISNSLEIKEIKSGLKILNDVFNNKLTYKPIYIID